MLQLTPSVTGAPFVHRLTSRPAGWVRETPIYGLRPGFLNLVLKRYRTSPDQSRIVHIDVKLHEPGSCYSVKYDPSRCNRLWRDLGLAG